MIGQEGVMDYGFLLAAVFFTGMAIRDSWITAQRRNLDEMLGTGAGDGEEAEEEIEEHRRFAVPMWLLLAGACWVVVAHSL
mgnify:CR=1 FL=1